MPERRRIYLDNAATSWPKPKAVYDAVDDYQRRVGAAVGRSGYAEAEEVAKAVDVARAAVARLIGAESPDRIVFTSNGTDSLNLAIHGLLTTGDHVITTVVEHNSVLRPLRWLEDRGQIRVTRIGCNGAGVIDPDDVRAALRPETKLIVLVHASNVTGAIQPAQEVGQIARDHGVLFLLDAAQTVGHMPISVGELRADLLAAPGHKGLLGPLGTGVLYIREGVEAKVDSIRQGGTGSSSSDDKQPNTMPEKYESGNHNASGIIGLGAGVTYLEERGLEDIRRHAIGLTDHILQGLSGMPSVEVYGPRQSNKQMGVVSFTLADQDPLTLAKTLDDNYRIQARAGFQCAALMHRALGTLHNNGTVRFGVGPFSREEDVRAAVEAISDIAAHKVREPGSPLYCPCVSNTVGPVEAVTPADLANAPAEMGMSVATTPGLQRLWAKTTGDPRVAIAVIDGPVDSSHPCFNGASIKTIETGIAGTCSEPEQSSCLHGTHVASILFAQHSDGSSLRGIAPQCVGLIIPVFRDDRENPGRVLPCSQADLARAIDMAREHGARIINISAGQTSKSGAAETILTAAVKRCVDSGILIVSAAGNDGCQCLHVPAALPGVIVVGAIDSSGRPAEFSNFGSLYQTKGILAPGEGIQVAVPGGSITTTSGTSFAAPIVSGVAALLLSSELKLNKRHDALSGSRVRDALLHSAKPCTLGSVDSCQRFLTGTLDLPRLIHYLDQGEKSMKVEEQQDQVQLQAEQDFNPQGTEERMREVGEADVMQELEKEVTAVTSTRQSTVGNGEDQVARRRSIPGKVPRQHRPQGTALVTPSSDDGGCSCGNAGPPQLVFALGSLSYDFGTQARYDGIAVEAGRAAPPFPPSLDTAALVEHFKEKPHAATSVIWTLNDDATPIYVIRPDGPFARETYAQLVEFLDEQIDCEKRAERVSIPGYIMGSETLMYGQSLPVIVPELRGMSNWTTGALVEAVCGRKPPSEKEDQVKEYETRSRGVRNFLDRIYFEIRNLGQDPRDRALNFAATNAFNVDRIFQSAAKDSLELDEIDVTKSAVCRVDSDCWDVLLIFFDPSNVLGANSIRRAYRFTVDVSDLIPVQIGDFREWAVR